MFHKNNIDNSSKTSYGFLYIFFFFVTFFRLKHEETGGNTIFIRVLISTTQNFGRPSGTPRSLPSGVPVTGCFTSYFAAFSTCSIDAFDKSRLCHCRLTFAFSGRHFEGFPSFFRLVGQTCRRILAGRANRAFEQHVLFFYFSINGTGSDG